MTININECNNARKRIVLFRGDDTDAFSSRTLTIHLEGEFPFEKASAKFTILDYSVEWESIPESGDLNFVMSSNDTGNLPLGPINGMFFLYDKSSGNKRLTIANRIPFFVTNVVGDYTDSKFCSHNICGDATIDITFVSSVQVDSYTKEEADEKFQPKGDYIESSEKGIAGGVATLGEDGKVPSRQLPVVDVPVTSVNGKTGDVELSAGDVGTYTKKEIDDRETDIRDIITAQALNVVDTNLKLTTHEKNNRNPHEVTAAQVGAYTKEEADEKISEVDVRESLKDYVKKTEVAPSENNTGNAANADHALTSDSAGSSDTADAVPWTGVTGKPDVATKSDVDGLASEDYVNTKVKAATDSVDTKLATKQDKISDLDAIRAGAEKGATALQTAPVTSVNGETGDVIISPGSLGTYSAAEIDFKIREAEENDPQFSNWKNGNEIAVGYQAIVNGSSSIVIGAYSKVDYANSIVLGYSNIGCNSGVVIGNGHDASKYPPYSVVLGDIKSTDLRNFYIGQKLLRDLLDEYFSDRWASANSLSEHLIAENPHHITADMIGALDSTYISANKQDDGSVRVYLRGNVVVTGSTMTLNGSSDGVLHQLVNNSFADESPGIPKTARDEVEKIVEDAKATCLPAAKGVDGSYAVEPKTTFSSGIDLPSVSSTEVANVDGVAAITPVNTGTRLGFVFSDGMTSSQSRLLPDGSMVLTQSVADERYAQSSDVVGTSSQLAVVDGQPTAIEHGKFYCWRPSSTAATPVSVTLEDNGLENEARLYLDYRTAASQITLPSNATVLYRDGSVKLSAFAVTNRYFVDLQWFSTTQREGEWESKFIVVVNAYKVSTAE